MPTHTSALDTTRAIIQNPVLQDLYTHQRPQSSQGWRIQPVSWPSGDRVQTLYFFFCTSGLRSFHLVGFLRLFLIYTARSCLKVHLQWLPFSFKRKRNCSTNDLDTFHKRVYLLQYLKVRSQKKPDRKMKRSITAELSSDILFYPLKKKKKPKHLFLTIILFPVLPLAVCPKQKLYVSTLFNPALSQR